MLHHGETMKLFEK